MTTTNSTSGTNVHEIADGIFSHVEADESGSLNEWLAAAPRAETVCSNVAVMVHMNDLADRPARGLADGDEIVLGKKRVRWLDAPHLPHNWECGS